MSLIKGVFFVFLAGNFASFGNFLYNLAMGRMLTPATYGELEAILSLSILTSVPLSVLSIFIVKIVSSHWGSEKRGEVKLFLAASRRNLFIIGLAGSLLLLLFSPILVKFLNLSSVLSVVFLSLLFLLSGLSTVNNSGLSGTLSFGYLAANSIFGAGAKLGLSVILVFFNFQLFGALFGPVLGSLLSFLLSGFELKSLFKKVKTTNEKVLPEVLKNTFFPTLFASLALTAFLTVDVILARHFLSGTLSGQYAIIAVLGKIVYFAVGPVISVSFPLISSRAGNSKTYMLPLLGSLAMVLGVGSLISFILFMFPELILKIIFAGKYLDVAPYLGPYSFFMVVFSVNSVLTYFLLSVSYFRWMWLLLGISILQGLLIILFHSSINQLIWVNVSVSLVYFVVVSSLVIKKECQNTNFLLLFRRTARLRQLSGM